MAKKRAATKEEKNPDKDLLARIRTRFKVMTDADRYNRSEALKDLKFVNVPGEQWDENMKRERGKRPCYEFNKLRVTSKRVINDMRANRPAAKVRGVEGADKQTAEVYEGLGRNIWNMSDGDTVIDYEAQYQVDAGMGAWRIETAYVADDAFDQDILVRPIPNPFCLHWDPAAKDQLKSDAADWILEDRMSKSAYERRWPKAEVVSWEDSEHDDEDDWEDEETVRVVEYWYKEPYQKEIWQLQDGKVIDAGSPEAQAPDIQAQIKRKRQVTCDRIKMCIASGSAILQKADWAGPDFPFVVVFGEYVIIDGRVYWFGLPRFAKDAQRSYNVSRTSVSEKVAAQVHAKWWVTAKQAEGNTASWAKAHKENLPYLIYNPDTATSGQPPAMMTPDALPVAAVQELQLASEEIKAVTGIYDASLGAKSNEQSGKAIVARQQQGEIATFNFADNMGKAIRRTWEILIRLIPKVYDTERELRVLGTDGAEDYVKVNTFTIGPDGQRVRVNDLAAGRYDVTVTVGPSWATKRMEAAEVYMNLGQAFPPLMQVAGDLIMKSMDLPYSEDVAERLQAMLPPQIQQVLSQGKSVPPEAQAVMQQAAQAMQIVEQKSQLVQAAAQEVEQEKAVAEKAKQEVQQAVAELQTQRAQFEAFVAKQLAAIAQKDAQSAQKGAQDGVAADRDSLATEVQTALAAIQQAVAQYMQQAAQTLAEIQARSQPQVVVAPPPPRPKVRAIKRVKGDLVPVYEDEVTA